MCGCDKQPGSQCTLESGKPRQQSRNHLWSKLPDLVGTADDGGKQATARAPEFVDCIFFCTFHLSFAIYSPLDLLPARSPVIGQQ